MFSGVEVVSPFGPSTRKQRLVFSTPTTSRMPDRTPQAIFGVLWKIPNCLSVEHDNPAVSTDAIVKVGDRFGSRLLGRCPRQRDRRSTWRGPAS